MKITTQWLKEKSACLEGVEWFEQYGKKNVIIVLKKLITERRLSWANWLIVRVMDYKQYVSYAVFAAEQVIGIYEKKYPDDKKPRRAIEAAKKYIDSPSEKNKTATYAAAYAAYVAAHAAHAAYAAAYAAYAAAYAADAAPNAAYAAYAAYAAAHAAYAAAHAANGMKVKILQHGMKLLTENIQ